MSPPEVIVSLAPQRGEPALDHAVSLALLRCVQAGEAERVVRMWRPVPALALGRLDVRSPGAPAAVAAARAAGFPAIRRLSG
ncbi:MAG TPA: hypothetical protein VHB30_06735, partial [Solirubrobacteraceae bacterium]|nr:hypothetical protein [Solirubrobacteraceae bacterium]